MQSTWTALVWKEWRELRWKVAAIALVAVAVQLLVVAILWNYRGLAFATADGVLGAAAVAAACFLGMGIAAGEQSAGTIGLLQSLPVPTRRAAAVKLVTALLAIIAVIGTILVVVWVQNAAFASIRDHSESQGSILGIDSWYASRGLVAFLAATSILLWGIAAGVNAVDEIRAAAIAFVTMVFAWGVFGLLIYWNGDLREQSLWGVAMSCLPGGLAILVIDAWQFISDWRGHAVAAAVIHFALAWWYVTRFGRVAPARLQTVEDERPVAVADVPRTDWLAPPRRGPFAALLWKQFRESGPLAMLGGGGLAMACIAVSIGARLRWVDMHQERAGLLELTLLQIAGVIWAMVGYAIALVAGISVFMDDLRPELQGFWRSRPIPIGQWFSVKLLAGLGVTVGFLLAGLAASVLAAEALTPGMVLAEIGRDEVLWATAVMGVHVFVYLAATALMAYLRHPVYAGVLAAPSPYVAGLLWIGFLRLVHMPLPPEGTAGYFAFGLCGATITSLITAAWLAVKHDWGWKH
ncbi:MAG: hypothetical protein KF847_13865 [Pirellulales bacterium]|nr:hypothetical protein [Pirellulales bacterium]